MQKFDQASSSKLFLSLLISFQLGLQPLMAQAGTLLQPRAAATTQNKELNELDSIWQQFAEAEPTSDFKLSFSATDPAIDQDPYFMRAQKWVNSKNSSAKISFLKTTDHLEISIPQTQRLLILNLPLSPIQSTEEFIFLSLDNSSDLFKKAAGKNSVAGEGIFFLSRADLAEQSLNGKPAPIFFFPLAGSGWTGPLSSLEMPQIDALVIANKTESVSLELRDVETVMKAQQINLMMASALSAKNRAAVTNEMYPAAGMTAAFGLFFTGLDLQMPEKSMWSTQQVKSYYLENKWYSPLVKKISNWLPLAVKPALAFVLPPPLIARLVFVGSVLTGMLAASIVIKYAHPGVRQKIQNLRASQDPIKNPVKLVGREIKETFDVFASVTSTASQVASVTFANSLELFLDRFAPTVAAAEHSLIRRFLNNTFYFSRNSVRNVPVNSRTFVLGALVMGGVDTAMVGVQYAVAVPMIAQAASSHLGPDMQARINETFDPLNPNTKQIALQDTIRNGVAYIQMGASSYSMEAKAQVIDSVTKEVEDEMKSRGLDPAAPQNQLEKQNKIDEKINLTMKQKGLPDKSQFLFDASTAFSALPKALGYKTPEALQAEESFILERRFGLSKNALDKAIQVANEWIKNDSSETARESLALLEETARSMSFLKNGLTKGQEGLQQARAARQQLTILSYEGSIDYAVKYIPETWSKKYSSESAQAASLMFRQALYSYLSAEGDELLFANKKNMEKYGEDAKLFAFAELKKAHLEVTDINELSSELQFELKLRTQVAINNLARAEASKNKAEAYAPAKLDWLARRKQARALKETDLQMTEFLKSEAANKFSDEQLALHKQRIFRDSLARQIGLYIEDRDVAEAQGREDYVKMLDLVDQKAQDSTANEIKSNPNMARYFEKLTEVEKVKMQMMIYANNYFQNYKEATTEVEMVKPTDAAQPGRFQKLRQTEIVRNSAFLTKSLRTLEAFGDDQSMKLGWGGALARNVPLASDLFSSHKRMLKTILPALSVSYAWNFFAWQVHIPYATWVMLAMTSAATISTPSMWLNRVFRLNGMKAMDSVMSKIAYSLPYAWVTFAGMFPIMLFSGDVNVFFSDSIRNPVLSLLERVEMKDWIIGALGLGLITQKVKEKFKSDFNGKAQESKALLVKKTSGTGLRCTALFQ
jgi:hypothetical protein